MINSSLIWLQMEADLNVDEENCFYTACKQDWARAVKHGGPGTNELLESSNLVATVMVIIS